MGPLEQGGDDAGVGGREGELGQLLGPHPAHLLTGQRLGLAAQPGAQVHHETQALVAVGVLQHDQLLAHLHLDRQLLLQLAANGFGDRLAGLLLAAGEFPQPAQQAPIWTLVDQHLAA